MNAYPELTAALQTMLDRMDASLRAGGYAGPPIVMYLAGGVAVNYWCGTRYTEDVDAHFSRRFVLPADLTVNYRRSDGREAFIYFDPNYNTSFALLHPDFEENSGPWEGIGNEHRLVHLHVLQPLDLAVSKLSRFSEQDRLDIQALAALRVFTGAELRKHALAAMSNYVGDKRPLTTSLELACQRIEAAAR